MKKIALLGFGIVGKGTYDILDKKSEEIKRVIGEEICVTKILKRNLNFETTLDKSLFTNDYDEILNSDIDLIVEMTGDKEQSYVYIKKALENKIGVVSANKAVISEHFEEFLELSEKYETSILFEAAVAGSIPIITPLKTQSIINDVNRIRGILNGTSNFLLSKMYDESKAYDEVLKEAQDLGYAEANPYDDVEGVDALRKLRILSTIAFGGTVKNEDILLRGISSISDVDMKYLKERNLKVKLIAEATCSENSFKAVCEPVILKGNDKLFGIDGADNSVEIFGENYGSLVFVGQGAGMYPTGNAVVSDIVDIFRDSDIKMNTSRILENKNDIIEGEYYLRISEDLKINNNLIDSEELLNGFKIIKTKKIKRRELINLLKDEKDYFFARYEN